MDSKEERSIECSERSCEVSKTYSECILHIEIVLVSLAAKDELNVEGDYITIVGFHIIQLD